LSFSSGSSPRELGSGNDSSSSSAWQHAYDLLANSAVKVGVAPDAYSYALVAETGMLCGACSEAKHLYWEARRQFAHQARLLDDLETKLWKVWSHKELSEICERVRNDHVCVCVREEMY
jgi:hemoglobin-like flavoprotein